VQLQVCHGSGHLEACTSQFWKLVFRNPILHVVDKLSTPHQALH
jgi:hypothetical protein